jgi:hypothetical protein
VICVADTTKFTPSKVLESAGAKFCSLNRKELDFSPP